MLDRLTDRLKARRRRKRDEDFSRAIERYRKAVLAPLGLDTDTWREVAHSKNKRVFVGEERVWKFFRSTQRRNARNFAAASRIARENRIASPRLDHADVSAEAEENFRLCSIVMERIEGRELTREEPEATVERFAAFLAAMHRIESTKWGECHALREGGYFETYYQADVARELESVNRWIRERGGDSLPDPRRWFDERREGIEPMGGRFRFVSGDAHPHNFMVTEGGQIALIDLDRSRFLDFPLDLTYVLLFKYGQPLREGHGEAERIMDGVEKSAEPFLRAYFAQSGEGAREHWRKNRKVFFVRTMLQVLWSRVKNMEPKYRPFLTEDPERLARSADRFAHNLRVFTAGKNRGEGERDISNFK